MARAVALNVAANTNEPGVRGPIYPDGRFEYVPIPESEPTATPVPTYADLDLDVDLPPGAGERPVHLDPEFAEYPGCERYTYGDPFGVKARPLLELTAGDYVFFYATLTTSDVDDTTSTADARRDWIAPDWGAYVVGQFRLARDPLDGDAFEALPTDERAAFANNAHVKRETFDAAVLLLGDDEGSELYETAVPLSSRERGVDANRVVTDLSSDSGKGPWWRRPMRFDEAATTELLSIRDDGAFGSCFG
ncbi:Nmad3 family putative nucleotide modification protein [Halomicrococcus gelatinilyticus]|uniref:Nmad3 family putative nucleotide modification protein n=1 Tax=Halomicrococcus gelatinilyticus TaxID=1702103 RepID=UPI002E12463F